MEFFTFETADFQVLEDIEFDETIQRPEAIRFFTLSEQTTDAFERLIPPGRVTKYQLEQIRKRVDRYEELYSSFVVPTAENYELREPSYAKRFNWIYPIYASRGTRPYNFPASWNPLFENPTLPNFYPRMLAALPHPWADIATGQPYPLERTTEFLNDDGQNPLRALPTYHMSRTQVHEDRTIDVLSVPVQGTADAVNFTGYYLAKRPVDVPNPLPDHPFLKSNVSAVIPSTAPLAEIVPSLDAILTHAVPVTHDPYGEGMKYLSIYDVRLSDIPWNSWRSRFPPVEVVSITPALTEIPYPKVEEHKPSEKLESAYKSKYEPGLSSRYWLMSQPDGGELVIQMLRSEAIQNGSVESIPGIDILPTQFPSTTLDDPSCDLVSSSFNDFMVKGILRREFQKNDAVTYTCVPLEFVKQERARVGYKNRLPWKESTPADILRVHMLALNSLAYPQPEIKRAPVTRTPAKEESERRREILAVIADDHRLPEDKVRDVQELLKDTFLSKSIYSDSAGLFIACAHTLALLAGDLAADRLAFYDTWTAREDGFRVCKFCGEHVNSDVMVDQDEFDEDGFKIRQNDALEQRVASTEGIKSFTTDLVALKSLFDLDSPMDSTAYLLLSVLQVLPSAGVVDSMLKVCRGIIAEKFNPKKAETVQDKEMKGSIGIALVVILLQIHIPSLIPRRSFGSQPLVLSGFPRDADKPGDYTIVDSLLFVLRRTFEAYPTSFKGPAAPVVRAILDNEKRKKIKQQVVFLAGTEIKKRGTIKAELQRAAHHVKSQPVVEQPKALIPVVPAPAKLGHITRFTPCPTARPILAGKIAPKIVQTAPPLVNGLFAAKNMKEVTPSLSVRERVVAASADEVRARLKKKPKDLPPTKGFTTNLILASRIADAFQDPKAVRSVDTLQKPDVLRDVAQGFLFETVSNVRADPVKANKLAQMLTGDVTLYTLTADYKGQKSEVNKLRARERLTLVERLARKNDQEREDIGELLKIGLAPYVVTNQDRILFAREAEQLNQQMQMDAMREDDDTGVGRPRDNEDENDVVADNGDFGDYRPLPDRDGRDQDQPSYADDGDMPI